MLLLGIDDAGRGPLIGPMILAGVLITNEQERKLKKLGAKDSKQVVHTARVKLAKMIEEDSLTYNVQKSFPDEIDSSINGGTNLNTLEAKKAATIINEVNIKKYQKEKIKVILDCPSVNTNAWLATLVKFVDYKDNLQFVCEHKADANYPVVGAASILAKVAREEEVEKIKKKYGNIGSGYPSDPFTVKFLQERGAELKDSGIFRKSWATWKTMFPGKNQSTLEGF